MEKLVIAASPARACELTIVDDNDNVVYSSETWYLQLFTTVQNLLEHHDIEQTIVCGPQSYTEKIKEGLLELTNNVTLKED